MIFRGGFFSQGISQGGLWALPEDTDSVLRLVRTVQKEGRVSIRRMGSFVNDVFLVKMNGEEFVAKRYTNWVSLKWFTLNLYGLGSVRFSVSGRKRMEAEYYYNDYLGRRGIAVPQVLAADAKARIILFSYVPGDQLSELLGKLGNDGVAGKRETDAAHEAGVTVGAAHQIEVALGDTKPENFIVDRTGRVTLVDLEQGKFKGDYSWDVAEFLYYSGHYWLSHDRLLRDYVAAFIDGYLEEGNSRVLKLASSARYVRVFSLWTPPNILYGINKTLQES
jgi:tRNA A-37 threonylcarbamoyl transferase component Bud32